MLLLGELVQFGLFKNHRRYVIGSDFELYAQQSEELLSGMLPDTVWKPAGAGLWIALYRVLFGDRMVGFGLFSAAALGTLPLLAFWFVGSLASLRAAVLAAAFVAVSPVSALHSALAETPAAVCLAAAFVAAAAYRKTGRIILAVLAAALLFWAYLSRPDFILYFPAVALVAVIPGLPSRWKKPGTFAFIATFGALLVALCLSNLRAYGRVAPVRYDSYLRFYSVFQAGKAYQVPENARGVAEARASLANQGVLSPADAVNTAFFSWYMAWFVVRQSLHETTGSWYAADAAMDKASLAVIRANVRPYVSEAARTFAAFATFGEFAGGSTGANAPESAADYYAPRWQRFFDGVGGDVRKMPPAAVRGRKIFLQVRDARENSPFNNYGNPYDVRYLKALSYVWIIVYAGVIGLFWCVPRSLVVPVSAMLISVALVFAAYATGGLFDPRYLASHGWCLWALSGWGYALAIPRIAAARRRPA